MEGKPRQENNFLTCTISLKNPKSNTQKPNPGLKKKSMLKNKKWLKPKFALKKPQFSIQISQKNKDPNIIPLILFQKEKMNQLFVKKSRSTIVGGPQTFQRIEESIGQIWSKSCRTNLYKNQEFCRKGPNFQALMKWNLISRKSSSKLGWKSTKRFSHSQIQW